MRLSRVLAACGATVLVTAGLAGTAGMGSANAKIVHTGKQDGYLVLTSTASGAEAVAAKLRAQGAKVTSVNNDVGMVVVRSDDANFRDNAGALAGVKGVAADRVIGKAPDRAKTVVEQEHVHAVRAGQDVTTRKAAPQVAATVTRSTTTCGACG